VAGWLGLCDPVIICMCVYVSLAIMLFWLSFVLVELFFRHEMRPVFFPYIAASVHFIHTLLY
jgi:hypothetical protein